MGLGSGTTLDVASIVGEVCGLGATRVDVGVSELGPSTSVAEHPVMIPNSITITNAKRTVMDMRCLLSSKFPCLTTL